MNLAVHVPREQHDECLPKPDVSNYLVEIHGLIGGRRTEERLEDHHPDQSPEHLRDQTGDGGGPVLEQSSKIGAQNCGVGAHSWFRSYIRATISSMGGLSTKRSRTG